MLRVAVQVVTLGVTVVGYLCLITGSILLIVIASINIHGGSASTDFQLHQAMFISLGVLFLVGFSLLTLPAFVQAIVQPLHPGNIALLAVPFASAAAVLALIGFSGTGFYNGEQWELVLVLTASCLFVVAGLIKLTQHEVGP